MQSPVSHSIRFVPSPSASVSQASSIPFPNRTIILPLDRPSPLEVGLGTSSLCQIQSPAFPRRRIIPYQVQRRLWTVVVGSSRVTHRQQRRCRIIPHHSTKKLFLRVMVIVAVSLILCALLGFMLAIPRLQKSENKKEVHSSSNTDKASKMISRSEVSLHNKRMDCWIIIKAKVYDVTSYVEEHPGGDAILAHAGDDSTEGFFGPQHATRVFDMIGDFCIGDLEQ